MRLSEAIRLGAMLRPQIHDAIFALDGSCAMGAAYEACGVAYTDGPLFLTEGVAELIDGWNGTPRHQPLCPICHVSAEITLCWTVAHLNDEHRWTREQIADWVATIESQDAETPVLVAKEAAHV